MGWLNKLFFRRRMYAELSEEIREHLEEKIEELVAGGMSRKDAEAAARREFGNVTLVEEDGRGVWRWAWIEDFLSDVRYGLRGLRKNPGFTAIATLTLALGIGATTAIYSVTYATLLAPLPYPNPDRLVIVWPQFHGHRIWGTSAGDFLDWKRQSNVFEDLTAWDSQSSSFNLVNAGHPEQVWAQKVLPEDYRVMGVRFLLGRNFLDEEGKAGKEHVAVLTHKLWKRLGANNDIVGRQLRLNGEPYTIVGVTAPGPLDRIKFDLIVPLVFKPDQINHAFRWLFVMGRLKPGVTLAEAQANMNVVAQRIAQDHPDTNKNWEVSVEQLQNDFLPAETKVTLWLLLGAVGFVLCIACVNVANLLLARSSVRQSEVAVRVSLGATRQRIFAQFLTESLVLALAGGALGAGLAAALVKVIAALLPEYTLPSEADVKISMAVLMFTLAVSVAAGVSFGCAPAWQASSVDPNRALKGGKAGGRHRHLRQALVVMEFGLALTLLCGAGMAMRSFWNLAHVELGVRTDHILTLTLPVPEARLTQPEEMVAFYGELLAKVRALPGVSAANVSTGLPVEGTHRGTQFSVAGTPPMDRNARPDAGFQAVTPGYFEAFGIEMVKGRPFTEEDRAGGVRVAVVNENFVRRYLPNVDPLTQRIVTENKVPGLQGEQPLVELQIVGVFRNVRSFGLRRDKVPEMDVPFWQNPWPQAEMSVRTASDVAFLTPGIQEAVNSMESDLPLVNVKTMDQIVDDQLAGDRFSTVLYGSFAGLALLLAAVGIYGVMAFAVAQRTHEIGLRLALGAGRSQVMRMVLNEGALLALVGLGVGSIGAYLVGRVLKNLLYGVAAMDFTVISCVALTLLIAALGASYVPAWRAAKVDPMIALRYE